MCVCVCCWGKNNGTVWRDARTILCPAPIRRINRTTPEMGRSYWSRKRWGRRKRFFSFWIFSSVAKETERAALVWHLLLTLAMVGVYFFWVLPSPLAQSYIGNLFLFSGWDVVLASSNRSVIERVGRRCFGLQLCLILPSIHPCMYRVDGKKGRRKPPPPPGRRNRQLLSMLFLFFFVLCCMLLCVCRVQHSAHIFSFLYRLERKKKKQFLWYALSCERGCPGNRKMEVLLGGSVWTRQRNSLNVSIVSIFIERLDYVWVAY